MRKNGKGDGCKKDRRVAETEPEEEKLKSTQS